MVVDVVAVARLCVSATTTLARQIDRCLLHRRRGLNNIACALALCVAALSKWVVNIRGERERDRQRPRARIPCAVRIVRST